MERDMKDPVTPYIVTFTCSNISPSWLSREDHLMLDHDDHMDSRLRVDPRGR